MTTKKPEPHGVRYPWDKWFARDKFTLRRGEDFMCMPHGMAQAVRNTMDRFGWVAASIDIGEDSITVTRRYTKRKRRRAKCPPLNGR